MAVWTYLIADLRSNVIMAEVPMTGVRLGKRLGDAGSFAADMQLAKLGGASGYDLTLPARRVLYALRDGRPWAGGIIWTHQYQEGSGIVSVSGADWWSYFDKRKVLPLLTAAPPVNEVAGKSTTYTQVDQNTIAANLVALAQSHTGGDIGVTVDANLSGFLRDRTYYGYDLASVGEMLKNLAQVIDGPDMTFDVGGPDNNGRPTRLLRLGTPHLGQQGSPWVLDAGGNVTSWSWSSDGSNMTTRAYATGDGSETALAVAVATTPTRITDGWPLLETDKSYSTVTDAATLQGHADADAQTASLPLATPSITLRADADPTLGEYNLGDDARLIVPTGHEFFAYGLDVTVRIIGIDVAPSDGVETVALTVAPITESLI